MAVKIQIRRDSSTNWTNTNPVLAQGELGLELDTGFMKAGNGTDNWNDLPYLFEFTEDLIPFADNTYDLGSSTKAYKDGYFKGNIIANRIGAGRTPTEALDVAGKAIIDLSSSPGNLMPNPGQITFSSSGTNRTDPLIRGRAGNKGVNDNNSYGLVLSGVNRNDETGFEISGMFFDVRRSSGAPITTGNAFFFKNYTTELLKIDHAGVVTTPKQSGFRAERTSTNQSIPDSSDTTLICNSENYDIQDEYNTSTGVFTAKTAGKYTFSAGVVFNANTTGDRRIFIRKNSTDIAEIRGSAIQGDSWSVISVPAEINLAVGDTVKIMVYQNSGESLNVLTSARTFFAGHKIA